MRKTLVVWTRWLALLALPAALFVWLSTTEAFGRALHTYGSGIATVCGSNGFCGGVLGLLLPPIALYGTLRATVFRRDREAAAFTTLYGVVLVIAAVSLSH